MGRAAVAAFVTVVAFSLHADLTRAATARPELDIARQAPTAAARDRLERLARDPDLARIATISGREQSFGVPTFLWAVRASDPASATGSAAADLRALARGAVGRLAPFYDLEPSDVAGLALSRWHDTGRGGVIATFHQQVDGVEVFRDALAIELDRDGGLVCGSGHLPPAARARARAFAIPAAQAAAAAVADLAGAGVALRSRGAADGYQAFELAAPAAALELDGPVRVKPVFFDTPEALLPGYYVEVLDAHAPTAYVIAAGDGTVLFRHGLLAEAAFGYRVYAEGSGLNAPLEGPQGAGFLPHPTGYPDYTRATSYVAPLLVSRENAGLPATDPWLPDTATVTHGNNVDAYADIASPDGFSPGDLRGTVTSPGTFDRTFDPGLDPDANADQQMAAATQLFYQTNWMHDWYYLSGFDEAAGNAQADNYGRGGVGGDELHAEANDYGGVSNANMTTPADGASPRMQMYEWINPFVLVHVLSPAPVAGFTAAGVATFGPQNFSLTGSVVVGDNSTFATVGSGALGLGSGPEWVRIADVNGDGHADLLAVSFNDAKASVYLSDGAGGFGARTDYPVGTGPYTVAPGDFDHDGVPDLVTANFSGGGISVLRGLGGGAFGPRTDISLGAAVADAAVARVNGDANDDIVTANFGAGSISVLLGNGTGGFAAPVSFATGASPNWVELADLNHDGRLDAITANYGSNNVSVLLGNGAGGFGAAASFACGGVNTRPLTLAVGDVNGDGNPDVVTANFGESTVGVLLGDGNGGLTLAATLVVPANPVTVRLADLNADGVLDVVVCCDASNMVSWFFGNGSGGFNPRVDQAVGTTPYGVAIGNVTGDADPDIVSANFGSNDLTLLTGDALFRTDGCTNFVNDLTGRIVLVDRASAGPACQFSSRAQRAAAAGAIGIVIADTATGGAAPLALGGTGTVTIPTMSITKAEGLAIKGALASGPVSLQMLRTLTPYRDGAVDGMVSAHEYGHYVGGRLIGNGSGLTTNQSGGLDEGWGDFCSLLVNVRAGDDPGGVYPVFPFVFDPGQDGGNSYYFGCRRMPYSTDFGRNGLTFHHIENGVPLPSAPPNQNENPAVNAERHNTGEVWAEMLWECYAALLADRGPAAFDATHRLMTDYLIAAMKLTPLDPTFTEARDAMLAAALARDHQDYVLLWNAFAKRGIGYGAVAPDRNSTDNSGVVESFTVAGAAGVEPGSPVALALALVGRHPVRGSAEFRFALPTPAHVTLTLHDVAGRRIATLADGDYAAGWQTARWVRASRNDAPPGIYFARLSVGATCVARRVVVLE